MDPQAKRLSLIKSGAEVRVCACVCLSIDCYFPCSPDPIRGMYYPP